jgi:DNA polymerase
MAPSRSPTLFDDLDEISRGEEAVPVPASLAEARRLAASCTRCPLYRNATQTVFGEGANPARLMLVGEQPGDKEDLAGKPFVGPAGAILDRALEEAGVERKEVFITNAVKHFKFQQRGKRRLHKRPDAGEIEVCRWWLRLEMRFVDPAVVVAMGATALRGVLGRPATVTRLRGRVTDLGNRGKLVATIHPSYLLRMPDREAAEEEFHRFVFDLKLAKKAAG